MSYHTLIGITTALVEKWGIKHGCEHHRYLIDQCSQLYEELQVRTKFVFVEYDFYHHIGTEGGDGLKVPYLLGQGCQSSDSVLYPPIYQIL